mmetsp:Transcript_2978/g.6072  ORF Transcript_2978/g.6072 Transcript_2978/m.6072 type:complete len:237 (-) Transcript_2978:1389-2099(-)
MTGRGAHFMQGKHAWVNKVLHIRHKQFVDDVIRLNALIGVDIHSSTKGNIFHNCQGVEGQQFQIVRNGLFFRIVVRLLPRDGISRHGTTVSTLGGANNFDAHLLHAHASIVQSRFQHNFDRLFRQKGGTGIDIDGSHHFCQETGNWNRLRHDADTSLAGITRVQECPLNCHMGKGNIGVFMDQIKSKDGISVAVGQGHEISTTDVKVSIKVGNAHTLGTPDAHDGFKGGLLGQNGL